MPGFERTGGFNVISILIITLINEMCPKSCEISGTVSISLFQNVPNFSHFHKMKANNGVVIAGLPISIQLN